jgi:hypothetical protein
MAAPRRLDAARRRAGVLKRALAAGAAAAFVVTGLAARIAHPGQATSRSGSSGPSRPTSVSGDEQSRSSDDFAIAPSTAAPQAQTDVS